MNWIKSLIVICGLFITTTIHFFWRGNKQEELVDEVVEHVVEQTTSIDISPIEDKVDEIIDEI